MTLNYSSAFSQNTESIFRHGRAYVYNNKAYPNIESLQSVINKNRLASREYVQYKRRKKTTKNILIASGVILGGSLAIFAVDNKPDGEAIFTSGQAIGIVGVVLVTPSLLLAGFLSGLHCSSSKRKILRLFNSTNTEPIGFHPPDINLNIQVTQNGIGLVLNF